MSDAVPLLETERQAEVPNGWRPIGPIWRHPAGFSLRLRPSGKNRMIDGRWVEQWAWFCFDSYGRPYRRPFETPSAAGRFCDALRAGLGDTLT